MLRMAMAAAILCAGLTMTSAGEPVLEKQTLFAAGQGGYPSYRIPALLVTPRGSLLAVCEARKTQGDWAAIDLLLRRSEDGGRTWSEAIDLSRETPGPHRKNPAAGNRARETTQVTNNNPLLIADEKTGAIHLLYCQEYFRCFYRRSDDDGKTFTPAVEITHAFEPFRNAYAWKVLATGPGHGVQLKSGRLIVPVWLSTATDGNAHRPSVIATLFSDDHGDSWQCGEIVADEVEPLVNPSESVAVELADGRVLLNMRSEAHAHRRGVSTSRDGATQWSRPEFDDELLEPICMSSMCRLSLAEPHGGKNRVLFSNPHNLERSRGDVSPGTSRDRKNLSIKLSYDECESWPVTKTLEAGASAYSDLAVGRDGMIYCLYERAEASRDAPGPSLVLATFNLEWLTDGQDSLER